MEGNNTKKNMKIETICEIRCLNDGEWFESPIHFGTAEAFFSSPLRGNIITCPFCNHAIKCNIENMRFGERRSNGRVTYIEGEETI